jgi:hypothetical protein
MRILRITKEGPIRIKLDDWNEQMDLEAVSEQIEAKRRGLA